MTVGVPGAEPLGFYEDLARVYDAEHISSDKVRLELGGGTPIFNRTMNEAVRETADTRMATAIAAGRSVVYEYFLNTRWRRDQVAELALDAHDESDICLLAIRAQMPIVERRLRYRYEHGDLVINQDVDKVVEVAQRMAMHVELPRDGGDEEPLYLDGMQPEELLFSKIAERLGNRGVHYLADDDPEPAERMPDYGPMYPRR